MAILAVAANWAWPQFVTWLKDREMEAIASGAPNEKQETHTLA